VVNDPSSRRRYDGAQTESPVSEEKTAKPPKNQINSNWPTEYDTADVNRASPGDSCLPNQQYSSSSSSLFELARDEVTRLRKLQIARDERLSELLIAEEIALRRRREERRKGYFDQQRDSMLKERVRSTLILINTLPF
jgi:hypothetical protein